MGVALSHKDLLTLFEGKSPERRQEIRDAMGGCPFDPDLCPDDWCDEHWTDEDEDEDEEIVTTKRGSKAHMRKTIQIDTAPLAEALHTWAIGFRMLIAAGFALVTLLLLI